MKAAKRASQIKGFMRFSFFKQALSGIAMAPAVLTAFPAGSEAAEAADTRCRSGITGLKPGANENKIRSGF
jgi:hypothetical protein